MIAAYDVTPCKTSSRIVVYNMSKKLTSKMKSKFYKYCVVPQCGSTTTKTPNKLFIYVPSKEQIRRKWLKLAKRDPDYLSKDSRMYFCEDHFDVSLIS